MYLAEDATFLATRTRILAAVVAHPSSSGTDVAALAQLLAADAVALPDISVRTLLVLVALCPPAWLPDPSAAAATDAPVLNLARWFSDFAQRLAELRRQNPAILEQEAALNARDAGLSSSSDDDDDAAQG